MKQVNESFSALMDNEADEFDLRRTLKTLEQSPEAASAWRRYHLARSMMRREQDSIVDVDISAGVMAALADEPKPAVGSTETPRRHSFSFMGGAAVAAAVSLMVITGVQVVNGRFAEPTTGTSEVASSGAGSVSADLAAQPAAAGEAQATPASMQAPASSGLPYFGTGGSSNNGLMTVGESAMQPMFSAPSTRQSPNVDLEQMQTLQSYLERHSVGAAYSTGDNWMPLLRTPGLFTGQVDAGGATETR
ncbi:sigma-E factor negative regulatory protein [Salinicola avicenniae]|uniref:sigma-E factor negative regulatory protein n=1 Tax=Salinicola avicenniae TaxID=2916836 RepID=UPI002074A372|nr:MULTISPECIES: sigma-E factor negative regulatory protein [unclassified Salinicola]